MKNSAEWLVSRPPLLGMSLPATKKELFRRPGIGKKKLAILRDAGLVKPEYAHYVRDRAQRIAAIEATIARYRAVLDRAQRRLDRLNKLR